MVAAQPVVFEAGPITVTCARSSSLPGKGAAHNTVPGGAAHTNPTGPVALGVPPPVFQDCTTDALGLRVAVETNEDNGPWRVLLQHGVPSTARLSIPAGGFVLRTSGLLSCSAAAGARRTRDRRGPLAGRGADAGGHPGPGGDNGEAGGLVLLPDVDHLSRVHVRDTTDPARRITADPAA
ncbi:hypothetical protein ACFXKW_00685 [Streptomyces sp. NPDC059193]|uniref:hypothetical protein n=1 Tax=Streptomyces sp. NPDC059193 TaxID=3346763 RepID=UPI0036AC689F